MSGERTTALNLNAIQPTVHKTLCPQALFGCHFFKMSLLAISFFNNDFFPKVDQIIINTQRTTTSNLIQPTAHKVSRPQAFREAIFIQVSFISHIVLNELFSKIDQIIRNTENQHIKFEWDPFS